MMGEEWVSLAQTWPLCRHIRATLYQKGIDVRPAAYIKHVPAKILFVARSKPNTWEFDVGFKLGEAGIGILGR